MAYYIRYLVIDDVIDWRSPTLVEAWFPKQGHNVQEGKWFYERTNGPSAHKWVREGGHHETPLYVDEGRIRYARGA